MSECPIDLNFTPGSLKAGEATGSTGSGVDLPIQSNDRVLATIHAASAGELERFFEEGLERVDEMITY